MAAAVCDALRHLFPRVQQARWGRVLSDCAPSNFVIRDGGGEDEGEASLAFVDMDGLHVDMIGRANRPD